MVGGGGGYQVLARQVINVPLEVIDHLSCCIRTTLKGGFAAPIIHPPHKGFVVVDQLSSGPGLVGSLHLPRQPRMAVAEHSTADVTTA